MEEWNKACLLRMNCEYEKQDGVIIAKLPQRMTQWYKIEKLAESDYRLVTEPEKIRVRMDLIPLVQKSL
jgi:agmatine/peptidylarginine deiminase